MLEKLGRYRHFKGNEYRVYGTCNNNEYILYKPLNDDSGYWIRPLVMFFEQVECEGRTYDRFALIEQSIEYLELDIFRARHSETMEVFEVSKVTDIEFTATKIKPPIEIL